MNLSFKMTQEAFEDGMKLHAKQQRKKIWIVLIVIVSAFFLLSTDFSNQKSIIIQSIIAVSFLIIYAFILYFIHRFHRRRQYQSNKVYRNIIEYTFSDEGVKAEHCLGDSFLKWESFFNYIEDEKSYLLYISPYLMYILPKSEMSYQEEQVVKNYLEDYISDG